MQATIKVEEVGQRFGHVGVAVAGNHRVIARTRVFPYGYRAQAYQAAKSAAEAKGYQVEESIHVNGAR